MKLTEPDGGPIKKDRPGCICPRCQYAKCPSRRGVHAAQWNGRSGVKRYVQCGRCEWLFITFQADGSDVETFIG